MNYARKYPRFWFWYFWASLALLLASYVATAVSAFGGKGSTGEIFGLAVSTLAMWPLYGYVRQRRLTPRWLWRLVLVLSGLSLLFVSLLVVFTSLKTGVLWVLLVPLGVWFVAGPHLFGIYQYVHRSPHIWSASEA